MCVTVLASRLRVLDFAFYPFFVAVGMQQLSAMFASEPVPKYFLEGGRWYWWWDDELWVWEEVRVFATLLFFFACVCFFGCRSGKSMQAGKNGSGRPGGHMTSSANGAVVKTFGKTGAVGRSGLGGAVGAGGRDECLIKVMLYLVHRTSSRQSCSPGGGPWIPHQIQATGWLHVTFVFYIFFLLVGCLNNVQVKPGKDHGIGPKCAPLWPAR